MIDRERDSLIFLIGSAALAIYGLFSPDGLPGWLGDLLFGPRLSARDDAPAAGRGDQAGDETQARQSE